jgi:hypothetical protein
VTPKVLPELNASQPHQSMKRPTNALVGLPMGGVPLISHRPKRGPSMMAATNAVMNRVVVRIIHCLMKNNSSSIMTNFVNTR